MAKSLSQSQNSTFVAEAKSPLFQAVLEGYPNPFAVFELNSNCLGYNRKFNTLMLELYGANSIQNSSDLFDLLTACGFTLSLQDVFRKIEQREILKTKTQLTGSKSAVRAFEIVFSPFFIVDNEIGGMTVLMTELFNPEQSISGFHFSEDVFRKAFFTTPDCVNINRFADGRYVLLNPGFTNILGYTEEDILGKTSIEKNIWYDQTDRERWAEELKNAGEVKNFITRFRAKDGNIIYATVSSGLIEIGGEKHVLSITRDISDLKNVEEKIKIREGELETLVNVLPDLVWLKDPNGVYLNCNKRFENFFGDTKDKIIGKTDFDFMSKELAEFFRSHDKNAIMAGKPTMNEEWVTFASDGHKEFLETIKTPMYDANNKLIGVLGIGRDLSGRLEAEEKLKKSEHLFKTVFEASPDIVTLTRLDNGVYLQINESFTRVLGYTSEEIVGKSAVEKSIWCSASDRDKLVELLQKNGVVYNHEFQFFTKTKEVIYGLMSAKVFLLDGVKHLLAITRPINDMKATQKALEDSEKKFKMLFGSMTEMVVIHEIVFDKNAKAVDYRILDCNQTFTNITGIPKENAVGRLGTEVYNVTPPPYLEVYSEVAITGNSTEFDVHYVPLDKHFMISVVSPLKNQFATITTDITLIKHAQEDLQTKNRELESYLYAASHDLRSPLVNIQGFSQRLEKQSSEIKALTDQLSLKQDLRDKIDKLTGTDIPRSLNFILTNVTKMDSLISGLLQISRTGRLALNIKCLDMNKLVNKVLDGYNYELTELGASVHTDDLPPCYGDENQLDQVFSNIIGNALKYRSEDRKPEIKISATSTSGKVVYSVSDNGKGIADKHLTKIWDVFYRGDASALEAGEGIGLSVSKTIITKHKGRVWVESKLGVGSIFYIELHKNEFLE